MEQQTNGANGLPENAYRELQPGEEYKPVMSPHVKFPEVTPWSVTMGLIMAVVFSAAAAYSGLKIGQVLEAAIPIAIIAVGASTAIKKSNALGQNVIIQSIGASSGVIVAGAIFTIPALYILKLDVNFWQIFFSAMLGGFLGILFLIPFRKYFVKDMHGKFPFPEATATTEILITGESGGAKAGVLVAGGLIGGVYDFLSTAVGLFGEAFTSRVLPIGEHIADKFKMVFQMSSSSMIVGFGYLVGLKFSTIIAVGSLFSWFVFVPLINYIGDLAAGASGINIFTSMTPEKIFSDYVRHIGIGAIAMAGIIGILKSSKIIGSAFSLAFKGIFGAGSSADVSAERTDKDMKMSFIVMFAALTIVAILIFFILGVEITIGQAIAAFLTVVIISFLFTTVAANAIAIVGSNPVSGMTLMTLILSSFILTQVGLKGEQGMLSAIIIGGVVCTALSMAGGFITDLKIGYWLGSTPVKQQSWKFLGTLVAAGTVGFVIFMLNQTDGFTADDNLVNNKKFTVEEIAKVKKDTANTPMMQKYEKTLKNNFSKKEIDNIKKVKFEGSLESKYDNLLSTNFTAEEAASLKNINRYFMEAGQAKPLVAPQANAVAAIIKPLMSPDAQVLWMLYIVGAIIALIMNSLQISPLAFALGMYLPLPLNTPLLLGGIVSHFVKNKSKTPELAEARNNYGTLIASGFIAGAAIFGVIGALMKFFGLDLHADIWTHGTYQEEIAAIVAFSLLMVYMVFHIFRAKPEK